MRILVVDDEPAVRQAVERALRLEWHDVALAAEGRQALDALDAWPRDPDQRARLRARKPAPSSDAAASNPFAGLPPLLEA